MIATYNPSAFLITDHSSDAPAATAGLRNGGGSVATWTFNREQSGSLPQADVLRDGGISGTGRDSSVRDSNVRDSNERGSSLQGSTSSLKMKCECLMERDVFDLLDHVYRVRQELSDRPSELRSGAVSPTAAPILIHVTDYHEAIEIDRCLSAVKLRTQLASPFSNWTNLMGRLGAGQVDVIISTTTEIPYADQIPWGAIYLPSALHLAMLTTPALDWLGSYWFARHGGDTPPRLVIRRTTASAGL
jgi:hypothetical protein